MTEGSTKRATASDSVARRLAEVRARLAPDVSLQQFLRLLDSWQLSAPVPLVVVTGGGTFRGQLAHRQEWSHHLDVSVAGHLRSAAAQARDLLAEVETEGSEAEEDPELEDYIEDLDRLAGTFEDGRFLRFTQLRQEGEQATAAWLVEHYGPRARMQPDVLDVPLSKADEVVQYLAPRNGFALAAAQVRLPGDREWSEIGYVRIVVAQVSAWWLASADGASPDGA